MKHALLATAVCGALAVPPAMAQAGRFAGVQVGVNVNFVSSAAQVNTGVVSAHIGDASQNVSLQGGYAFALGGRAVLGLGLSYSLTSLRSGSLVTAGSQIEWRNNDMYTAYIEPAYVLDQAALLYAKIAYVGAKGERISQGLIASQNYYGAGYGAGVRALLNEHLYLQGEFLQSDYGDRPIDGMPYKASSTTASLGLGYRF